MLRCAKVTTAETTAKILARNNSPDDSSPIVVSFVILRNPTLVVTRRFRAEDLRPFGCYRDPRIDGMCKKLSKCHIGSKFKGFLFGVGNRSK